MDQAEYLKARVDDQIAYYEKSASKAKKEHVRIQTSVIVLALLVPVLVNAPELVPYLNMPTRVITTIVSLLVAILNGVANLRKPGDLWLTYRMTEEHLKHEKFLFLTGSGKYAGAENQFSVFVDRIETAISTEHDTFRSLIESATRPTAASADKSK